MAQPRVQPGVPTGGQYSASAHDEADTALSETESPAALNALMASPEFLNIIEIAPRFLHGAGGVTFRKGGDGRLEIQEVVYPDGEVIISDKVRPSNPDDQRRWEMLTHRIQVVESSIKPQVTQIADGETVTVTLPVSRRDMAYLRGEAWAVDDSVAAESWKSHGFTASEARSWGGSSSTPAEASRWRDAGYSASAARDWAAKGFTLSQAAEWDGRGFAPAAACAWRGEGFAPQSAALWRRAGFDTNEAVAWTAGGVGFGVREAEQWTAAGYTPGQASAERAEYDRYTPSDPRPTANEAGQ